MLFHFFAAYKYDKYIEIQKEPLEANKIQEKNTFRVR
jgi:hypothetical protein